MVSFAPGTGGHFLGSVCQYLLYGNKIKILPDGSCHSGNVKHWGQYSVVIENSNNAILNELVSIQTKLTPSPTQVMVTHSRNIWALKEKFDKVIYIDFVESDIEKIVKKFKNKTDKIINEINYNNIKDIMWPSYEDFLQGKASQSVYDEIAQYDYKSVYVNWFWVLPALHQIHNVHQIQFSSLFGNNDQWVFDLIKFLNITVKQQDLDHIDESWKKYKSLQ